MHRINEVCSCLKVKHYDKMIQNEQVLSVISQISSVSLYMFGSHFQRIILGNSYKF